MKRLSVVGNAAIETKIFVEKFPLEEMETKVHKTYVTIGGSGACLSAMLSRFGFRVDLITQVGEDTDGDKILETLKTIGVSTRYIVRNGSTIQFYSIFDQMFRRRIFIKDAPWKEAEIVDLLLIALKDADALVLCPTTIPIFREAIDLINNDYQKTPLVVSPQSAFIGSHDILWQALKKAWIICLNEKEICNYVGTNNYETAISDFNLRDNQILVITRGDKGCIIKDKNNIITQEAIRGEILDPSGAGDSLLAGIIWALNQGYDTKNIALVGCVAGFLACKTPKLVEEGFSLEDVNRLLTIGGDRNE